MTVYGVGAYYEGVFAVFSTIENAIAHAEGSYADYVVEMTVDTDSDFNYVWERP